MDNVIEEENESQSTVFAGILALVNKLLHTELCTTIVSQASAHRISRDQCITVSIIIIITVWKLYWVITHTCGPKSRVMFRCLLGTLWYCSIILKPQHATIMLMKHNYYFLLETSRSMISPDVSTADVESKTVEPMSNESEESLNEAQSLPELEIHEPSESESSRIEVQSPSTPMSE